MTSSSEEHPSTSISSALPSPLTTSTSNVDEQLPEDSNSTDDEEDIQSSTDASMHLDYSNRDSHASSALEASSLNVSSVDIDAVLAGAAAVMSSPPIRSVMKASNAAMPTAFQGYSEEVVRAELSLRDAALQELNRRLAMQTAEVRRLEAERESLMEELGRARAIGERGQRKAAEAERQLMEYKADSEMTEQSLQSRVQSLTESLKASEEKCAQLESYGMRHAALNDDVKRLTRELEEARETASSSSMGLQKLATEMSTQAEALSQAQAERDLARRDRDAMERRVKHLELECDRKDRELEAMATKLSVVKAKKKELAAASERENGAMVAEAQRRVDAEIARLTEKQEAEVIVMKERLMELHSREVDGIRAQLDMAESARLQAVRKAEEVEAACDELKVAHARTTSALQRDLVDAQGMLQLQRFETDRATNLAEDRAAVTDELQQECKILREKVELLRNELDERRSSGVQQIGSIRAEMAVLKERLAAYEKMEDDMTAAVQAAISIESIGKPGDENDEMVSQVLSSVPMTSRRRVQENLLLTRRLQDLAGQLSTYKQKYERATKESEELREELRSSTSRFSEATRPQQYIAESLKTRDLEIAKHRAKLREADAEVSRLRDELNAAHEKTAEVEEDIRRLLSVKNSRSHKKSLKDSARGDPRSLASTIATLRSALPTNVRYVHDAPVTLEPLNMH